MKHSQHRNGTQLHLYDKHIYIMCSVGKCVFFLSPPFSLRNGFFTFLYIKRSEGASEGGEILRFDKWIVIFCTKFYWWSKFNIIPLILKHMSIELKDTNSIAVMCITLLCLFIVQSCMYDAFETSGYLICLIAWSFRHNSEWVQHFWNINKIRLEFEEKYYRPSISLILWHSGIQTGK